MGNHPTDRLHPAGSGSVPEPKESEEARSSRTKSIPWPIKDGDCKELVVRYGYVRPHPIRCRHLSDLDTLNIGSTRFGTMGQPIDDCHACGWRRIDTRVPILGAIKEIGTEAILSSGPVQAENDSRR